jgi:hypothetical protein
VRRRRHAALVTFRALDDVPGVRFTAAAAGVRMHNDEIVDQLVDLVTAQLSGPSLRLRSVDH